MLDRLPHPQLSAVSRVINTPYGSLCRRGPKPRSRTVSASFSRSLDPPSASKHTATPPTPLGRVVVHQTTRGAAISAKRKVYRASGGIALPVVLAAIQMSAAHANPQPTTTTHAPNGWNGVSDDIPARRLPLELCAKGALEAGKLPSRVDTNGCDLAGRAITDRGLAVVVPERGETVVMEAHYTDGADTLSVTLTPDGVLELRDVGVDAEGGHDEHEQTGNGYGSYQNPCSVRDWARAPFLVNSTFRWWYNQQTRPTNLTTDESRSAISRAFTNITHTDNDCGLGNQGLFISHTFAGYTTRATNINAQGQCDGRDNYHTINFGDLSASPSQPLAVACTRWSTQGVLIDGDVKIDKSIHRWTTTPLSGCSNRFDLESVMTHEAGHIFGLRHVSEVNAPALTMSPRINGTCQAGERTLGLGDVLGMKNIYQ